MRSVEQFSYNQKNELMFYGHNLAQLKAPTPSYVYSKKAIEDRASLFLKEVTSAFGKRSFVHYAMKANSHLPILKLLKSKGLKIDVVSGGELTLALKAGFKPQDILFSGVGKTVAEIKQAISKQIEQINVESLPELVRIGELCNTMKKNIRVGFRVNPGVNPKTHPYIATGFRENKFGIDFSQIPEALEILHRYPRIQYQGLSLHIGSQLFHFKDLEIAIRKALEIDRGLRILGFPSRGIDIGGGLGVDYSKNSELIDPKNLHRFIATVKRALKGYEQEVRFEPGRFLIARAGVLLTEIQYVKETPHKKFLIVDTGMNHLLRPALYQAEHRIFQMKKQINKKKVISFQYDVVGPVCESSDVLGKSRNINSPLAGDFLVIADAGAYGFSMASQYNSFPLPIQIFA